VKPVVALPVQMPTPEQAGEVRVSPQKAEHSERCSSRAAGDPRLPLKQLARTALVRPLAHRK